MSQPFAVEADPRETPSNCRCSRKGGPITGPLVLARSEGCGYVGCLDAELEMRVPLLKCPAADGTPEPVMNLRLQVASDPRVCSLQLSPDGCRANIKHPIRLQVAGQLTNRKEGAREVTWRPRAEMRASD